MISNESIIYLYLKLKNEVITLDQRKKELDIFIEERNKQLNDLFKSGNIPPEFKFIQSLSKLSGQELSLQDIKKLSDEKMDTFETQMKSVFKTDLDVRLNILEELELAYSVLKEEMPELVQKYTEHILNKQVPTGN